MSTCRRAEDLMVLYEAGDQKRFRRASQKVPAISPALLWEVYRHLSKSCRRRRFHFFLPWSCRKKSFLVEKRYVAGSFSRARIFFTNEGRYSPSGSTIMGAKTTFLISRMSF